MPEATLNFATYPWGCIYACHASAMMDKVVMLQWWVEKELKPHILEETVHVAPLLLLDSYCCHMMTLIIIKNNKLGVKAQHIPGG